MDKDARPAKRGKVDGNEAAGCRNLVAGGDKAGGGEEKENEEEEELKEKVDRLRGLLEDDPKKLGNKDVEDVVCYLDVDEIIGLALKSDQGSGNGNEQRWVEEIEECTEDEGDCEKVAGIMKKMLCCVGFVKRAEFRLLHEKLSPKAFTTLLTAAMDSKNIRHSGCGAPLIKAEERDAILKLCFVLPWKLFAHVLIEKCWAPRIDSESEEEEEEEEEGEECTPVQKEAAEKCDICFGKARHTGSLGDYCTFQNAIPKGTTVGTNYWITCTNCGFSQLTNTFDGCVDCD